MTGIGYALGKIPGVPSYADRGRKKLRKALGDYWSRNDADMIALVRSEIGWDFEPVERHKIDGQTWAEPLDSDGPWYPADGVPENPPELWGVPVAVGYRDFGCLPEVPNTRMFDSPTQAGQDTVAGTLTFPSADEDAADTADTDDADGAEESSTGRPDTQDLINETEQLLQTPAGGQRPTSASAGAGGGVDWLNTNDETDNGTDAAGADETDDEAAANTDDSPGGLRGRWRAWRDRRRAAKRKKRARKGLQMMQRGSTTLIVKQDGDSVLSCKPATYVTDTEGPEWYVTDDGKEKKFDAREAGSGPITLDRADIGLAFGPIPKLIAPVLPRIARNIHSLRVADNRAQLVSEQGADKPQSPVNAQNGSTGDNAAMSDGGQVRHNDVIVEERALIWPADIKLLGGEHETQDHLDTLEEQVKALANPPGGEWLETASKLGGIILAVLIGVTLGDPSGIIELIGGYT